MKKTTILAVLFLSYSFLQILILSAAAAFNQTVYANYSIYRQTIGFLDTKGLWIFVYLSALFLFLGIILLFMDRKERHE